MTSISHFNKPNIVLFAFLPLEAAFHKFSTLLLITFESIVQFRSNFFQTVCSHKARPPKGCLSLQIVAVVHHKPKNPKFWASGGQKIGLVGELFVKFSKIVLKFFIHNKKLISCHSRQFKILQKNFSHCPNAQSSRLTASGALPVESLYMAILVSRNLKISTAEVELRTQGSRPRLRTQKKRGQGQPFRGQTLSRPRTGMLEAKDSSASALQEKKKVFTKI